MPTIDPLGRKLNPASSRKFRILNTAWVVCLALNLSLTYYHLNFDPLKLPNQLVGFVADKVPAISLRLDYISKLGTEDNWNATVARLDWIRDVYAMNIGFMAFVGGALTTGWIATCVRIYRVPDLESGKHFRVVPNRGDWYKILPAAGIFLGIGLTALYVLSFQGVGATSGRADERALLLSNSVGTYKYIMYFWIGLLSSLYGLFFLFMSLITLKKGAR